MSPTDTAHQWFKHLIKRQYFPLPSGQLCLRVLTGILNIQFVIPSWIFCLTHWLPFFFSLQNWKPWDSPWLFHFHPHLSYIYSFYKSRLCYIRPTSQQFSHLSALILTSLQPSPAFGTILCSLLVRTHN